MKRISDSAVHLYEPIHTILAVALKWGNPVIARPRRVLVETVLDE